MSETSYNNDTIKSRLLSTQQHSMDIVNTFWGGYDFMVGDKFWVNAFAKGEHNLSNAF